MAELSKSSKALINKKPRNRKAENEQTEFELKFFSDVLERYPDYVDVLRVFGSLLTKIGHYQDGLDVDRRLVGLRPQDAIAHYNLACSYCLLRKHDQDPALKIDYKDDFELD